jgi:hypothetical protein
VATRLATSAAERGQRAAQQRRLSSAVDNWHPKPLPVVETNYRQGNMKRLIDGGCRQSDRRTPAHDVVTSEEPHPYHFISRDKTID